jgi:hypothetical protein
LDALEQRTLLASRFDGFGDFLATTLAGLRADAATAMTNPLHVICGALNDLAGKTLLATSIQSVATILGGIDGPEQEAAAEPSLPSTPKSFSCFIDLIKRNTYVEFPSPLAY